MSYCVHGYVHGIDIYVGRLGKDRRVHTNPIAVLIYGTSISNNMDGIRVGNVNMEKESRIF